MQNKGFIRVFSLLLMLVCLFYLSFSFVTAHYNKKAVTYAAGDPVKESLFLDSLANKKVWLGYTLKQCREMEVTMGLDLKGGMNVILELNVRDVVRAMANNNQDPNFNQALDLAYARQATSQRDFIDLFVEEYKKLDPGVRLSAVFSTFEQKDRITPQSTDAQVITVIREELKSAINNSFNVLRTRIDRFGVVSPNIQQLETTGRILVELPGIKEPERVRKLLQGSANLEFWETYDLSTVYQQLVSADEILAKILHFNEAVATDSLADSSAVSAPTTETVNPDNASSEVDSLLAQIGEQDTSTQTETMTQAEYEKLHPLFANLMLNTDETGTRLLPGPIVGYARRTNMAKVIEYLNMPQVRAVLPRNIDFKWSVKSVDPEGIFYHLYAIRVSNRDGSPALGGNVVTNAVADFAQQQIGRAEQSVSMTMNAEGAKEWARLTKENVGQSIAIVLDSMVYSAPRVNDEITGGRSQITGNFTPDEAKDLANVLKSGKMAASVHIIQEDIVGPSLGQEAIRGGFISFIIALIVIMAYMCVIYGLVPGLIADGALMLNVFFTMGVLASFQAVLTLPGIAGMVLSLAMSVDANVLIYERAKEELRAGKSLPKALADGYGNAFSAIFDGNATAIITGIVLFVFGTGPIRGFATTMIIGIAASFLTAVYITRLVYEYLIAKNKLKHTTFTTKVSENLLTDPKINFLGHRRTGYLIPTVIIALGVIAMMTFGLNNGIDFTGGRNYIVRFDQDVQTEDVRQALDAPFDGAVSVITISTQNQVRISTNYKIEDNSEGVGAEIEQKLYEGLTSFLPAGTSLAQFTDNYIQRSQKVGPSMADDIKYGAVLAVIIAMFFMALYILIRFRDFAFSVGVFVSTIVTTLCIIAFYSLFWKIMPFSMEIDQEFIAALLTVIGYSINDTVVVFDRVRETIRDYPKRDRGQVINDALNSTLSRTFNTAMESFLVVLCIFIGGGPTIKSFTFAILIGVVISTYTTLYIATPIAYEIQKRKFAKASKTLVAAKA
ncbi:MAG: protein translocase subunit SecDF [Tannerella sp.]|jgi:SecD/SecF fusion protein|nr:protein translocase subunit SecDF [Tannerella sp.]